MNTLRPKYVKPVSRLQVHITQFESEKQGLSSDHIPLS